MKRFSSEWLINVGLRKLMKYNIYYVATRCSFVCFHEFISVKDYNIYLAGFSGYELHRHN